MELKTRWLDKEKIATSPGVVPLNSLSILFPPISAVYDDIGLLKDPVPGRCLAHQRKVRSRHRRSSDDLRVLT